MELLAELARGIWTIEDGKKVYKSRPDSKAVEQLNAYQYGKPAQTTLLTGDATAPIEVHITGVV